MIYQYKRLQGITSEYENYHDLRAIKLSQPRDIKTIGRFSHTLWKNGMTMAGRTVVSTPETSQRWLR